MNIPFPPIFLKKTLLFISLFSFSLLCLYNCSNKLPDNKSDFKLSSSQADEGFDPEGVIAMEFWAPTALSACGETNNFPKLTWSNPPILAKSFVLIVEDADSAGGPWIHFILSNIHPNAREIPKQTGNSMAVTTFTGVEASEGGLSISNTSWGGGTTAAWGGPCPPTGSGVHRYFFKLYAYRHITPTFSLNNKTSNSFQLTATNEILATATLMGTGMR